MVQIPAFKSKNRENSILFRWKHSNGEILQKEIRVYFGTKLNAVAVHSDS
ncbi:hypothetical protein [Leptospira stimsonii]|nr:hypothetical protein [Leptospira stimsonii]